MVGLLHRPPLAHSSQRDFGTVSSSDVGEGCSDAGRIGCASSTDEGVDGSREEASTGAATSCTGVEAVGTDCISSCTFCMKHS